MIKDRIEVISSVFSDLIFDPVRHLYFVNGDNLPSVSKKVSELHPAFDEELMAPLCIKKEGVRTADEVKMKWRTYNLSRQEIGHKTHSFLEVYNGLQTPTTPWEKAGVQFILDMSVEYEILFREIRMYSREFRYAGTEDLILCHRETGDIVAADYKTNADLFKNYKGQTMLAPFDYLLDCPFNHYQIQLSLYQIMLEEASCAVKDRILVYLKEDGTYELFSLQNLCDELKIFLKMPKVQPVLLW